MVVDKKPPTNGQGPKIVEDPYRALYERTPIMMHSIDREGLLVRVNDHWLDVLGYERDEVIGRRSIEFLTDTSRRFAMEDALPEFYWTGFASDVEYQMVKKNGQVIDVVLSAAAVPNDVERFAETTACIVDVSGQKRVEQALREGERQAVEMANENRVLADLGRIINSSHVIDDVYQLFASEVRKLIPFDRITISEVDLEAETITPVYVAGFHVESWKVGEAHPISHSRLEQCVYDQIPLLLNNESTQRHAIENPKTAAGALAGLQSGVAAPLISRGQTIGTLNLSSLSDPYTERDKALTERVGTQIAGAIANAQLFDAEKKHQKAILDMAVLEERNRLAREIHDTLAHSLTGIVIKLERAGELINERPRAAQTQIEEVRKLARQSLEEARRSVWDLHPQADISESLTCTIEREVASSSNAGVEFSLDVRGKEPQSIDKSIKLAVLRIVQEALVNILKHARAKVGKVQLSYDSSELGVCIADDGIGFDISTAPRMPTMTRGGFGLISMQERARLVGGDFEIRSAPGQGAQIDVRIPFYPDSEFASVPNEAGANDNLQDTATESIRVLIVDDQELVRQGIRSMLEQSDGLNVVGTARDGEEALEAIRLLTPDVVLLDVKMPKLDRVQTTRKLQELGLDADHSPIRICQQRFYYRRTSSRCSWVSTERNRQGGTCSSD